MKYLLSKFIPMRFHSTYGVYAVNGVRIEGCTWWQWRDRILKAVYV